MTATIADLLDELLRLEAAKTRGAVARDRLESAITTLYRDTGTAPTLRLKGRGTVSLSVPQPGPQIVDVDAFASWVAQRRPSEVETSIEIRGVSAEDLGTVHERIVEALTAAGYPPNSDVKVGSRVGVREAYRSVLLDTAVGDRDAVGAALFDPETIEQIDGVQVCEPHGEPSMRVLLDKDAKARAQVTARAAAENDLDGPPAAADADGMTLAAASEIPAAAAAGLDVVVDEHVPPGTAELRRSDGSVALTITGLPTDVDDDVEPDRDPAADVLARAERDAPACPVCERQFAAALRTGKIPVHGPVTGRCRGSRVAVANLATTGA